MPKSTKPAAIPPPETATTPARHRAEPVTAQAGEEANWLEYTPEECEYTLLMEDADQQGQHLQEVNLTRAEFIALKAHLAELRGLSVAEAA
jgi:hypothetical protein